MDKKRQIFRDEEKAKLRQLVLERKDVVECKKSDMVSLLKKKEAWEEIGKIFNSAGLYPNRTTAQLKKLWENQKAKRKAELALEKREVIKTGGGSRSIAIPEDPELDSVGVNIELKEEAMDSDTDLTGSSTYVVVDGILVPASHSGSGQGDAVLTEVESATDVIKEEELVADESQQRCPTTKGTKRTTTRPTTTDEITIRIKRNEMFLQRDGELHEMKMREQQLKVALLQQEQLLLTNKIRNEKEMFELKVKHELELFELERKKKTLEIKKLEEEL